ncbi:hypothetical protein LEP48_00480 [Isoptericola sp. NEAU-Y5]|uniref:Tellurium resistance protein n=1 Tax=Isoptericola luteus TaxID=2879484 RepID=A0ABS7Z9X1_9MICO|nr:hypothetical protein [Isoptericola sp. NEAU-Y5]MCA5891825.1 hypothetical protein [Isoptericola sp. NEAU-Y5]
MGFLSKLVSGGTTPQDPVPAQAPTAPAPAPAGGVINLAKGQSISLKKTALITATVSWPPSTDYDVYAIVHYRDGRQVVVSTFGTKQAPSDFRTATQDGAVRHLGDVQRGGGQVATETLEIRLNPEIVAVAPVVYSAQSNGTGSFRRYQVTMRIEGGDPTVVVPAPNASSNNRVYTCVPGIILNAADGVRVESLELYSRAGSEQRPVIDPSLRVVMDAGQINAYK